MSQDNTPRQHASADRTRREFLTRVAQGAAAGAAVSCASPLALGAAPAGQVRQRTLGRTGLKVSEIGFGGHSWNFKRVPDGQGGMRRTTVEEAMRMISLGLEMGVNFFDSCSPREEHSVPGEVIKRLKKRQQVIVSARLCHKMKGVPGDVDIIYRWVDERLKLWQTDWFDILMLTNSEGDTPESGYWDMSYSLQALAKLKQQGKIRFAGFGCHFKPDGFRKAFANFGRDFEVCSMPYNIRHRVAEELLPEAKKLGMGVVTIKAFARGEILKDLDLAGADAGLARDMIAFVLESPLVDCCIPGMHTEAHVRENFPASWTPLTEKARQRLKVIAQQPQRSIYGWLERDWLGSGRYAC
jgi:aryl-alcohol dehydrogenase-like predicted oxidoreductase